MIQINNSDFMSLVCDLSDEIVENKTTDFNSTYDQVEGMLIKTFNLLPSSEHAQPRCVSKI